MNLKPDDWNQLSDWISPWADDPDLKVCFAILKSVKMLVVLKTRTGTGEYDYWPCPKYSMMDQDR